MPRFCTHTWKMLGLGKLYTYRWRCLGCGATAVTVFPQKPADDYQGAF